MIPVIDFHTHPLVNFLSFRESVLKWARTLHPDFDGFVNTYKDPAAFVEYLESCGVDYAVVLAETNPAVTGSCTNEEVFKFCANQAKLIPFASINPYLDPEPGRLLEYLVCEQGFKGVKLYPTYQYFYPNDRMVYPLYAKAESLQVPVMIHTGSSVFKGARLKYGDPLYLDDVAVDFPSLSLILVHGGRGFWYDKAFLLSRLHPNVYLEVAGLPPQKLLEYFPDLEHNGEKIIFGSDWPGVKDIKQNIEKIKSLSLNEITIGNILGGNAAGLLHLGLE
ncbi:MAG: amidohydrolase family protein [Carboxydocellales bacterium]